MFWSRCAWRFAHTKVAAMKLEMSYGPNFDVQLKKKCANNPNFDSRRARLIGCRKNMECVVTDGGLRVFSGMFPDVCSRRHFWSWGNKERHVVSKQQDGCQVTDTEVLRAERVCLVFLRQMEDPVKALTEIRLWGGGIDRWWSLPPSQRRRSKHLQSRASITQREEEWTQIMSLPWCSALIWLTCAVEFDIITAGNDQIIGLETHLYSFCKVLRSFSYRRLECCRFMSTFSIKVVDYVAFNTTGNVYCNNSDKTLIFDTLTNRYDHIFHST